MIVNPQMDETGQQAWTTVDIVQRPWIEMSVLNLTPLKPQTLTIQMATMTHTVPSHFPSNPPIQHCPLIPDGQPTPRGRNYAHF